MQVRFSGLATIPNKQVKDKNNLEVQSNSALTSGLKSSSNYAVPTAANFKALYLNNISKSRLSFGHTLDENLTSWGGTVNDDGAKFKVWTRWAKQVFVQAVPADSPDPTETDKKLKPHEKAYPWNHEAEKIKFHVFNKNTRKFEKISREAVLAINPNIQTLVIPKKLNEQVFELQKTSDDGVFESDRLPKVKEGYKYRYIFVNTDGQIHYKHDPISYKLDNVNSWSTLVDHKNFDWGKQKRTIDPKNPNVLTAPNTKAFSYAHNKGNASQVNVYEMHLLSGYSDKGDYDAAKKVVDSLTKKHQGITHIELMPAEMTYSKNWGYDGTGTGKFAPSVHPKSSSPNPDAVKDLKDFIKYTQDKGLGVIIDMVPNHYSHDFAHHLAPFGPYESFNETQKKECEWGKIYNYEGPENGKVRDNVSRMALNWLVNYNANGLRLDMTKYMHSRNAMKQLSQEVRYHVPDAILIAEDGNDDDHGTHCDYNVTHPLPHNEAHEGQSIDNHIQTIQKTARNESSVGNIGFDSQWGFHLQHTLYALVSGAGYPMNGKYTPDVHKLENMFKDPLANTHVIYPMSHDEKGNLDGTGIIAKVTANSLDMYNKVEGTGNPGHIAGQATQNMIEAYYFKGFSENDHNSPEANEKWTNYQKKITYKEKEIDLDGNTNYTDKTISIKKPVSLKDFKAALDYGRACHKLALGTTFAYPSPKMILQGDEYGSIEPFYFFRDEPPGYDRQKVYSGVKAQKGYDYLAVNTPEPEDAFNAFERTKLKKTHLPKTLSKEYAQTELFTRKLGKIVAENPALKENRSDAAHLQTYAYDQYGDKILQVYRRDDKGNHVLMIMNFGDKEYKHFGLIRNPDGNRPTDGVWKEVINSDEKIYGGSGEYTTKGEIKPTSDGTLDVKIPKKGFIILKRQ